MELNQYLEVFIEESKEHLQACNEQLLELEKNPQDLTIINEIFRSAHTLKGMSATMGYEDLASLTHQMENVLDAIRNNRLTTTPEILDVIFMAVDHLEDMVQSIASGGDGKKDVTETVEKLKLIEKGEPLSGSAKNEVAASAVLEVNQESHYDEFELTVLKQSKEQGFGVYEIAIALREDCLLKAARVYMVFEVLEKIGEVIKTNPSVEQLEEEQFDHEFTVTIVSKDDPEDIKGMIMKVSEVVKTDLRSLEFDNKINEETIEALDTSKAPGESNSPTLDQSQSIASEVSPVIDKKGSVKQQTNSSKTIRVNIERLDILMNLFEELVIDRGRLEQISKDLENGELTETVERMSRISGDLQNIILNMRMVQVETVFNRFPRMIRQLARDLNKKINLEIVGAETELDRTVIDEIGDPLVHLLRNSVDHGIESPEVRKSKGKNEEGTVVLRAFHSGNHVFIEIEDDGAGISRDKVLKKAISKGIITEQSAAGFTDKQAYELILSSGFSTAETISDISGRGVGLDVVKNTIESLGGSISIDSKENEGTIFSIQLPLTLSIISVMLVEIQKEKFAIPLSSIIETAIIKDTDIMNAHNQKVIDFRGKVVPLLFLKDIFEVPSEQVDDQYHSVIIVRKGDKMAGLIVDSFIGQQEVVLKSLGNYLTNVFAISGATILGDGQVALIVDCNALIK
ncbi:chemotaxis protein CheA [Mesobacillus selenatarsenatis]|uniref:Chemotaxis protein CheA n=1 Tax=Mesobacillus selenatarsenatis (strain DSM 18680 / JCM 14380 / FERM P-15431 / SF-1) TaxID=1321606 RepID=A0A0A8X6I5_MESS1|nr:chemotaxis protein CheA [Mesobacillus selenatarsenatis]GAM15585.1 signal transduction histidine kinase CheA [Mesobacillus selenatarsenatis SF-1]